MPNSPSITILERDQSQYAAVESTTSLAMVGYATKGPIESPTLTTSFLDFVNKFGPAPKDSPYSSLAARRAFRHTNKVVFSRIAEDDAAFAERVVVGTTGDSNVVPWNLRIRSKEKGTALNGSFIKVEEIDNPVGDNEYNLEVYYLRGGDSILVETFEDVSLNKAAEEFFVTRINASVLNKGSTWIGIDLNHGDTADSAVTINLNTMLLHMF